MSESQYTQGPWTYYDGGEIVANDDGKEVASLFYSEFGVMRSHANGRLIAAAPDLLAACQAMMLWFALKRMSGGGVMESPIVDQVRKAIEKATEGQKERE